jgi:hypothetical protein
VGDLGRRLGLVRVGVETLVADLQSVDAVEEEVRPLRELAAELGRRLGPGVGVSMAGRPELERLRDLALAVLRAFATAQAPTAPTVPPAVTAEPPSAPTVRPVPTAAPPSAPTAPPGRHEPRDPGFWRR